MSIDLRISKNKFKLDDKERLNVKSFIKYLEHWISKEDVETVLKDKTKSQLNLILIYLAAGFSKQQIKAINKTCIIKSVSRLLIDNFNIGNNGLKLTMSYYNKLKR